MSSFSNITKSRLGLVSQWRLNEKGWSRQVLISKPDGFWRLGEATGATTAADSSGNVRNGTYTGGPTLQRTAPLSDSNKAVLFAAASSQYVTMGDVAAFEYTGAFSIMVWFKTSTTGTTKTLIAKADASAKGWSLQLNTSDQLRFRGITSGAATVFDIATTGTYADGNWHLAICTWDGTTGVNKVQIYVDGAVVKQGTASAGTIDQNAAPLSLAALNASTAFHDGYLDDAATWPRELSATEITAIYATRTLLDSVVSATATDNHGTNHGTYKNGVLLNQTGSLADRDPGVVFDGVNDYVDVPNSATLNATNFSALTYSAVLSTTTLALPNGHRMAISFGTTGQHYISIKTNGVPTFFGSMNIGGAQVTVDSNYKVQTGVTYYVALVYDGANLKIYVNGYLQNQTAATGVVNDSVGGNAIGDYIAALGAGWGWTGTIEEAAVYNRALTAREVLISQACRAATGPAYTLHFEASGINNGWTDLTQDLMDEEFYNSGLPGPGVKDRTAMSGEFHFTLNNSAKNSQGLLGLYSPDHANRRAGWDYGVRVRYGITTGGVTYYDHVGTLDEINPVAGLFEDLAVQCTSVDYMDDLARTNISNIALQLGKKDSEIFSTLIASMPRQPSATEVGAGLDTFQTALDNVHDEETKVLSVINDLNISSLSLTYVKVNDVLTYETRSLRATSITALDTFDSGLFTQLDVSRARMYAVNRCKAIAHLKSTDAAPTSIVYKLNSPLKIPAGSSITLFGPYTDPNNQDTRIGATNVQALVANTDYTANTSSDGTGLDITGSLVTTGTAFFGNTAMFVLTNGGGVDMYVRKLEPRGQAVRDYSPAVMQADDATSQASAGVNLVTLDQIYQSDAQVSSETAFYVVNLYKDARTAVKKIGFRIPNSDDSLASRVIRRQISDRIALSETVTGLPSTRHFFINAKTVRCDQSGNLTVEWILAPADSTQYWLLEIVGRSELDSTTRLGFGLIVGHTDIAHGDNHADVAHGDVAHGDVAHIDVTHQDSGHGDTAHSDAAHSDVSHSDVAHTDNHSDTAHADSHSDTAHTDTAHSDSHSNSHDDIDGVDFHFDSHNDDHQDSHGDIAHADSHDDTAHSDTHNDVTHSDVAHSDVAHSDVAHVDGGHQDAGHQDTAHTDVLHTDVTHQDTHSDSAHGDIN